MASWRLEPRGDEGMKAIEIGAGEVVVGRGSACGVHDARVSRRHLILTSAPDGIDVRAVGMSPPEIVRASDGVPEIVSKDSTVRLKPGDRLFLLTSRFPFELVPSPPPAGSTQQRFPKPLLKRRSSMQELEGLADFASALSRPPAKPAAIPVPAAVTAKEPDAEPPKKRPAEEAAAAGGARVANLKDLFPELDDGTIREALEKFGTVDAAAAALLGGRLGATTEDGAPKRDKPIDNLATIFPGTERSVLEAALSSNKDNVDAAVAWLLGESTHPPRPPPAVPPAMPLFVPPAHDGGSDYGGSDEEFGGSDDEAEWGDDDDEETGGGSFDEYHYGPPPASDVGLDVVIKIDKTKPAQSLRDIRFDPARIIRRDAMQFTEKAEAQFAASCFTTMIEREQQHYGEFFCFYHSYSFAALLYELQSELARSIYDLDDDFAPLPRLLQRPFHDLPTMDMLLEEFKKLGERDHAISYRSLAISVSCSLFAPRSEAPPTSCFKVGYSCTDVSWRKLLTGVLSECKIDAAIVETLADRIVDLGEKYHLLSYVYREASAGVFGGVGLAPSARDSPGHMLQLFIHRDYVDSVAYSSRAYGIPTGKGKLSEILSHGCADGQARIFLIPEVFIDPKKARIYWYSADAQFAASDPSIPGSRGAFIHELRDILGPITGDHKALRRAYRAIRGLPGSQDP